MTLMKSNILKRFVKMRASLEQERIQLQKRLNEIQAALGSAVAPEPATTPESATSGKPKRKLSAANKAKLIAGIKARWAKYRAEKAGKVVAPPKAAKPKKFFSAAARARLAAAAKARWAKAKKAGKSTL